MPVAGRAHPAPLTPSVAATVCIDTSEVKLLLHDSRCSVAAAVLRQIIKERPPSPVVRSVDRRRSLMGEAVCSETSNSVERMIRQNKKARILAKSGPLLSECFGVRLRASPSRIRTSLVVALPLIA